VEDFKLVEAAEASDHVYEYPPHFSLLKMGLSLLVFQNFLIQVPIISEFHNDAEGLFVFYEGIPISHHIAMSKNIEKSSLLDGSQNSYFVKGVLPLLHR